MSLDWIIALFALAAGPVGFFLWMKLGRSMYAPKVPTYLRDLPSNTSGIMPKHGGHPPSRSKSDAPVPLAGESGVPRGPSSSRGGRSEFDRQVSMRAWQPGLGSNAAMIFSTGGRGLGSGPGWSKGSLLDVGSGDINFSVPVTEAYLLLLHERISALAPLGMQLDDALPHIGPDALRGIIMGYRGIERVLASHVGKLELEHVDKSVSYTSFRVRLDLLRRVQRDEGTRWEYAQERWTLRRGVQVATPPSALLWSLGCPGCGNTGVWVGGRCPGCDMGAGQVQSKGWQITGAEISLPQAIPELPEPQLVDPPRYPSGGEPMRDFLTTHPDFSVDLFLGSVRQLAEGPFDVDADWLTPVCQALERFRAVHRQLRDAPPLAPLRVDELCVEAVLDDAQVERISVYFEGQRDEPVSERWVMERLRGAQEWRLAERTG